MNKIWVGKWNVQTTLGKNIITIIINSGRVKGKLILYIIHENKTRYNIIRLYGTF